MLHFSNFPKLTNVKKIKTLMAKYSKLKGQNFGGFFYDFKKL